MPLVPERLSAPIGLILSHSSKARATTRSISKGSRDSTSSKRRRKSCWQRGFRIGKRTAREKTISRPAGPAQSVIPFSFRGYGLAHLPYTLVVFDRALVLHLEIPRVGLSPLSTPRLCVRFRYGASKRDLAVAACPLNNAAAGVSCARRDDSLNTTISRRDGTTTESYAPLETAHKQRSTTLRGSYILPRLRRRTRPRRDRSPRR